MKFSEAVVLGSTDPKMPFDPWRYNSCLLGVGIHVFSDRKLSSHEAYEETFARWPWIKNSFAVPAPINWSGPASAEEIISCFAFKIRGGEATLEQAVDWIRSVEPPDPEVVAAETEVMRSELCEAAK